MGLVDMILLALVGLAVVFALRAMFKSGGQSGSCHGGCQGCNHQACQLKKPQDNKE